MESHRPTWHQTPRSIWIRVDPSKVTKSPLGNEVSIRALIGGSARTAVVPMGALDETSWTVEAAEVGEIGNAILISFAPTSMGTTTWPIPKEEVNALLVSRDPSLPT